MSEMVKVEKGYLEWLESENKKLREALKLHMKWIGPPPKDKYSYDSLREDAWEKGKAALEADESQLSKA